MKFGKAGFMKTLLQKQPHRYQRACPMGTSYSTQPSSHVTTLDQKIVGCLSGEPHHGQTDRHLAIFRHPLHQTQELSTVKVGGNKACFFCPASWSVGFLGASDGKESACSVGDLASIPGLGRSPGEGNNYPFSYSCLENSMNRGYSPWDCRVRHD